MGNLTVTEFKDVRVLTTQQIAESYKTTDKVISNNFNRNKERYQEGKHYILLQGEELKKFKTNPQFEEQFKYAPSVYLWTEKGAFLHAKSLNTDKAWEVYGDLVDTYFRAKKPMSAMQLMELQFQTIKEVDHKVDTVNKDLQEFKMDMPILGIECDRITSAVKRRGVNCLGGKESEAYKDSSLRSRVYSDIYGQLKREFGVSSYKAIKRSQTDKAVKVVETYVLPMALEDEIGYTNAQMIFQ